MTVVRGGPFTVTETDTYQSDVESYRTDVKVTSTTGVDAPVFRAADCYLQNDDHGLGVVLEGKAPTCNAGPASANPNRLLERDPLTDGSRYFVGFYDAMWTAVAAMPPLPNTVQVSDPGDGGIYDNAAALSWSLRLNAGQSRTFSDLTVSTPSDGQAGTFENRVVVIGADGATFLPFEDAKPITVRAKQTLPVTKQTPRASQPRVAAPAQPVTAQPTFTG